MNEIQTTEYVILFTSLLSGRRQIYSKDNKIVKYDHSATATNQTEFMIAYADNIEIVEFTADILEKYGSLIQQVL